MLKSVLEECINCKLSDPTWQQSSLPVRLGGLGMKQAAQIALPCYLSSLYACKNMLSVMLPDYDITTEQIAETESAWSSIHDVELPPVTMRTVQKSWEIPVALKLYQN